jgi:hypothetical protein
MKGLFKRTFPQPKPNWSSDLTTKLTKTEATALYRPFDRKAFDAAFQSSKTGRTDRTKVLKALLSAAAKFEVEGDFAAISKRFAAKGFAFQNDLKVVRTRVNEVIDSNTDESVKQVRKSVKLTSGKVDLGKVTEEVTSDFATKEDLGLLGAKVDKLAEAMALIAAAIAPKS